MLKTLHAGTRRAAGRQREAAAPPVKPSPRTAGNAGPLARQSGRGAPSSRARASTSRAPRRRPGMSSSTSPTAGSTMPSAIRFGVFPTNDPALVDAVSAGARRAARLPDRRAHAARGADRRRVACARAGHAVPAHLLHHRRRAPAEGQGARRRRGSRRRCRDARRARRDREIPRRPPRPGSLHRGARSAAAAALFDLVVAQGRSRPPSRSPSMRCATTSDSATRLGVASTFLAEPRRAGRPGQGLCAEGARLRPAGRSADADHHDRPRHRHRAVPRLPARAHGDQGAAAATGCSSATSAATATSSTRTN